MRSLFLSLPFLSASLVMIGCAGGSDSESAAEGTYDLTAGEVSVATRAGLSLNEISGLGVRTVSGKPQYLAVGDSSKVLLTFGIGADGAPTNVKKNDLKSQFGGGGDSQWEAVAGDSAGNVFIMSEGDATIAILDSDLKLKHTIRLSIPEDSPEFTSWDRDENSRGEGMLLLANGHILVAKEKGPSAIIEFAPEGEEAQGYTPALAPKGAFAFPKGSSSEFVAVKSWELKASAARLIGDMSDLSIDKDGSILVLSDQSRAIGRIERELTVDEDKIDLKAVWELPREVEKPEGLVIANGAPVVACDLGNADSTSFFTLSAL